MKISEEYRKLNQQLHKSREDYGTSGQNYARNVAEIIEMARCRTVLDYGCGKQTLAKALPQYVIRGYDPCIPGLDTPPKPADLVVCTDVLEHIEPESLIEVLDHLEELTTKVIFLTVSTRPAKKFLADGRNAHINLRTRHEWLALLMARFELDQFVNMGGEFLAIMSRRQA